jgi:aspartokinase/homoserine dehydrogenase 1
MANNKESKTMNQVPSNLAIHKFGGTSLGNPQNFRAIPTIVNNNPSAIVVSAVAGTTTQLQQLLSLAEKGESFSIGLAAIKDAHLALVEELISSVTDQALLIEQITKDCHAIQNLLQSTSLLGGYESVVSDKVFGYGELWSAQILNAFLSASAKSIFVDASKLLVVYKRHDQVVVDWKQSSKRLQQFLTDKTYDYLVITGFIACSAKDQLVTLGRNGSDYSAAIFAKLLNANKLVIWTDVDGIYSADPNKVRSAFVLPEISYEEALELAYFGAKVIHPKTIFPAIENNIPIHIKNSANPSAKGTVISADKTPSDFLIKGLSSIEMVSLVNIEGSGMIGVSGVAGRVFQALYHASISVMLISQASSEHSICLAVNNSVAEKAKQVLQEAFQFEIEQKLVKRIYVDNDCAMLAAIGDDMVGKIGIAGRLCNTLAKANVSLRAIAQGSSERNISVVVHRDDIHKALRAVHAGFYLSRKTLSVGIIGPGQVATSLLQQINETFEKLQQQLQVNIVVRGIMSTSKMLLQHKAIDLNTWKEQLNNSELAVDVPVFISHIASDDMPHSVIIDCTASQDIADLYPTFIEHGLHVITPNKRANSGDYKWYQNLQRLVQKKQRCYFYETTVCAGLPVIKTLQDLITTGDEVIRIEGVVSGTLSYIFNQLAAGGLFSDIIRSAKESGYTEPDPRDDLSGMDVARKFVCLARELGLPATLDDISMTNLVPEHLRDISVNEFMNRLSELDADIQTKLEPIFSKQQTPCYIGSIDKDGTIDIAIRGVDSDHPASNLNGTDNMLILRTKRYSQLPLVIQGPGAGTEVTATGIFADLLRLVSALD